eukprot:854780-Prorocentrum_lima.AAC.1
MFGLAPGVDLGIEVPKSGIVGIAGICKLLVILVGIILAATIGTPGSNSAFSDASGSTMFH